MDDLAFLLFVFNASSATLVALREFLRRGGYVTLPFLTSAIFLSWYLPQGWDVLQDPNLAPGKIARLFLMSFLCFWAIVLGWRHGLRGKWSRSETLIIPNRRLFLPVAAITIFAWAMTMLIEMQPASVRAAGQWTGAITIIAFFASTGVISLTLSTAMVMQRRNVITLLLFSANVLLYLPKVLIYFRRADTFELFLSIFLSLLFIKSRIIPRALLIAGAILGFFFLNGIGHLRELGGGYRLNDFGVIETRIPTLDEVLAIDWLSTVYKSEAMGALEVQNAAVFLDAISQAGIYTLGAQFWDNLIIAYIPGQLVGFDFKKSLILSASAGDLAQAQSYYEQSTGTTSTGFVDAYHDFWYFGCAVWWLSGYVMGRLMRHALDGNVFAFVLYSTTITNAVHITTHSGYYLFSQSVLIVLTVLLVRSRLIHTSAQPPQFASINDAS